MKKLLLGVVVLSLSLLVAPRSGAAPRPGGSHGGGGHGGHPGGRHHGGHPGGRHQGGGHQGGHPGARHPRPAPMPSRPKPTPAAPVLPRPGLPRPGKGLAAKVGYAGKGKVLARGHRGFGYRNWNRRYGCHLLWCGPDACWYYYYPTGDCYLPFADIASYPPGGDEAPEPEGGLPPVVPGGADRPSTPPPPPDEPS